MDGIMWLVLLIVAAVIWFGFFQPHTSRFQGSMARTGIKVVDIDVPGGKLLLRQYDKVQPCGMVSADGAKMFRQRGLSKKLTIIGGDGDVTVYHDQSVTIGKRNARDGVHLYAVEYDN